MKRIKRLGVIFFFLLAIVISNSPLVTRAVGAQTAPSINVSTSPQSPTPYDNVTIRANVTASSPIRNVTLYYRIGPSTLARHFNSTLDYNYTRMSIAYQLNNENGDWEYVFDKQGDGRVIYFYVEAVDSQGLTGTWADGWPEYRLPHIISVANPGQAQLNGLSVNLNYLLLSEQQQFANIPWPQLNNKTSANSTSLYFRTTLSRRVSPFYPPLVLMVTAFAVLGLLPIIAKYFSDKRFDLFLNVIILASSAELSQAIYPVGGLLSTNLFVEIFPVLLFCAIVLMAVSSPSDAWRKRWQNNGSKSRLRNIAVTDWEAIVTLIVMSLASAYIFCITNNMPSLPRVLTIVGGLFGSCVVIYLSAYDSMTSRSLAPFSTILGLTMIGIGLFGILSAQSNDLWYWFGIVIEAFGVLVVIPVFLAHRKIFVSKLNVRRSSS